MEPIIIGAATSSQLDLASGSSERLEVLLLLGEFLREADALRFSSMTGIISFEWASNQSDNFPLFLPKVDMVSL